MKYLCLLFILTGISFTPTGKYLDLFNGDNLDGWVNQGTEKWYVDKGELICESGSDYDDFDLSLEFKQEAIGSSGVFFRSTFECTKVSGWQVEVAPPENNTGGIYESYGRG